MPSRFLCFLLLCLILLSDCAGPRPEHKGVTKPRIAPAGAVLTPTRDFLMNGFDEDTPAPLFGYLLLPENYLAYSSQPELWQRVASVFWKALAPRRSSGNLDQSGITYWLTRNVERKVMLQAAIRCDWQFLLEHYHFERAEIIFRRIQEQETRPLLVVARKPLGRLAENFRSQGRYILILDLSKLPADKLLDFLKKYQKEIMQGKTLKRRFWSLSGIHALFRPFFGEETEAAVTVKLLK